MMSLWHALRRWASLWGFAAFVVVVLVLFHRVLLPFIIAVLLAWVLWPPVEALSRQRAFGRPVPRFIAVIIIYLGILGALGVFFGLFLPRLSGDVGRLFREAPAFFSKVKSEYAPRASRWLEQHFPSTDPDGSDDPPGPRPERKLEVREVQPGRWDVSLEGVELQVDPIGKGRFVIGPHKDFETGHPFDDMFGTLAHASETQVMGALKIGQLLVTAVVKAIAQLVLILMVTAFLLVDAVRVRSFLRSLVPRAHRGAYDIVAAEIDRGLSGVIRGQFLICLVNGLLTYLGLLILKVKYGLLLAMLAGGMSLVPVFGSILSSIPIVAVALIGGGGGLAIMKGLGTLGWIIGIHMLEANFLNPKIIGHAARIHPLVVIFSLIVGETTGGLVGALIAVPVASVVQTLFLFFRDRAGLTDDGPVVIDGPPPELNRPTSDATNVG